MKHSVSIVIIGRNEERGIAKCIEAAKLAAAQIGGAELLFVDSASTDETVAIVKSLGVCVISLDPSLKLSPSAGRYAGSLRANGEFILFIDADTHVYTDFLPTALARLKTDPKLAGLNGRIDDLNEKGEMVEGFETRADGPVRVKWLRGPCCLFRRDALLSVGSFNPHLAVEEEAELGLRLCSAGWALELIPVPMGCHTRCFHHRSLTSVVEAFKRDIAVGRIGEITRTAAYAFGSGNGLEFCWLRLKTTIAFSAWLFLGAGCLFVPSGLRPAALFAVASAMILGLVLVRKRSVGQTLLFFPAKFLCLLDVLAGVGKLRLKDPSAYFPDSSAPQRI
jgi:hypothetical protein